MAKHCFVCNAIEAIEENIPTDRAVVYAAIVARNVRDPTEFICSFHTPLYLDAVNTIVIPEEMHHG